MVEGFKGLAGPPPTSAAVRDTEQEVLDELEPHLGSGVGAERIAEDVEGDAARGIEEPAVGHLQGDRLAVELGASPAEVGLVTGFFFLPTLFVGPMGGVLADRVNRRNAMIVAQVFATVLSLTIFAMVVAGMQSLGSLLVFSFGFGLLIAVEVSIRQAFMTEMVPKTDISSAASLHATAWNTSRLLGPVVAGAMIAAFGSWSPFAFSAVASLLVAASFLSQTWNWFLYIAVGLVAAGIPRRHRVRIGARRRTVAAPAGDLEQIGRASCRERV